MTRYARKFIMLPIMPSVVEPAMPGLPPHILPAGAAKYVMKPHIA